MTLQASASRTFWARTLLALRGTEAEATSSFTSPIHPPRAALEVRAPVCSSRNLNSSTQKTIHRATRYGSPLHFKAGRKAESRKQKADGRMADLSLRSGWHAVGGLTKRTETAKASEEFVSGGNVAGDLSAQFVGAGEF